MTGREFLSSRDANGETSKHIQPSAKPASGGEYRWCRPSLRTEDDPRLRQLASLVTFTLALVLTSVLLNRTVTERYWRPYLGESDDKIARLRELAKNVDVLFVGTSHVAFAVNPVLFDAAMARAGRPTFSFNLGIQDMPAPERTDLLARLAAIPMPRLRYVLVEPALNHAPDPNAVMLPRMRYHYNWRTIREALQVKLDSNRPLGLRFLAAGDILRQFTVSNANLGVLSDLLVHFDDGRDLRTAQVQRGYIGDSIPREQLRLGAEAFKAAWRSSGHAHVFETTTWYASERDMTPSELSALRKLFDAIRRIHALPIAFIPPQARGEEEQVETMRRALREHYPEIPVLAYNYHGPDELYEEADWWEDGNHLSDTGSDYFSVRLAGDVAALVESGAHY